MWISRLKVEIECVCVATAAVAITALASPADVWLLGVGLHPAWLAVLVLAARYGVRGLLCSMIAICVAFVAVDVVLGGSLAGLAVRTTRTTDMLALGGGIGVAWIAMSRERRMAVLQDQLTAERDGRRQTDETVDALYESLRYMRDRLDRIDVSISMWRDVAARLERGDPLVAARAAVELCAVRAGATAGVIQRWDHPEREVIVWYGQWTPESPRPRDLTADATIRAAMGAHAPIRITEAPCAGEMDADVAVPIIDEDDDSMLGVIALRGIVPERLRAADLRDLAMIAAWLAPNLARFSKKPRLRAVSETPT